ncbi:hypothetical protein AFK68_09580 [Hydrocoleum sp. CS-953]|uniref:hypothetical protein n=1 Tax=Hydrocoleum sp. CS-953 TaxID=1671698 RepID=UPI000B9BA5FB|nr:hypothetical protein [Hydrocoleum sp. CS-953]OZH54651.1 hypothetical protein AFK68_09580 [Hydrocoleum sp. CS-953]
MIKLKDLIASTVLGAGLFLINLAPAQAIIFNWSFSNNVGGIDGTVSGTLELSESNGDGVAATSVILKSTTNPVFDDLVGFDFSTVPNFQNQFNVTGGEITAALFGTDFFSNTTNFNLEFNSEVFGDPDSQNLGLLTIAGNPLPTSIGGDGICPENCLQTAPLFGDNTGETEFAPTFNAVLETSPNAVPETSPTAGLLVVLGLIGVSQLRKTIRN